MLMLNYYFYFVGGICLHPEVMKLTAAMKLKDICSLKEKL